MSMRVTGQKATDSGLVQVRGPEIRNTEDVSSSSFRRSLTALSNESYEARIREMKDAIDKQGERLSDRVNVSEFEKFRKLIREFLDEIVSNGYTFSREDSYAAGGKHRYIATVKIVNEKLDELGKEVMKEQSDNIDVLDKVGDIRGLLLDLMT